MSSAAAETLGIYLHVPFCKHACPYCDFYKLELRDRPARARLDFPEQLRREWELHAAHSSTLGGRRLDTIYFGGGTPSTLVPETVGSLVAELRRGHPPSDIEPEITLEANPENLTAERSRKWRAAGINRLSIGVQSFDDAELRLLERLHQPAAIGEAVRNARAAGFANLSLDLMFALPGQTLERWLGNLRAAVALAPEHLSFYGLTYHEGTPFERWRAERKLAEVDEDLQAEMYLRGAEVLEAEGFEHYEISNFARPGFRSRHNQRYWSRGDVIGLGPGAHSNLGAERWANPEDLEGWATTVAAGRLPRQPVEVLDHAGAAAERLFTALRRREGLHRSEDSHLYEACLAWHAAAAAEGAGWMRVGDGRVAMTRAGWLVSDGIVEGVLRCFQATANQEARRPDRGR